MNELFNSVTQTVFQNVFQVGSNDHEQGRNLGERWAAVQHARRSKQWQYSFRSLNGNGVAFNQLGASDLPKNFDSQITQLLDNTNDDNYVAFGEELKVLYVASQSNNEGDPINKLIKNQMFNGSLEEAAKAERSNTTSRFEKNSDLDLSHSIVVKILMNEPLNAAEGKELSISRDKVLGRKMKFSTKEVTDYVQLVELAQYKGVDLNTIKRQIVEYCIKNIVDKYVDVAKNTDMQNDVFHEALSIYEYARMAKLFIERFPNNDYAQLFKQYLKIKEKDILAILNDEIAFTILSPENAEDRKEIQKILQCLAFFDIIIPQRGENLHSVSEEDLEERIEGVKLTTPFDGMLSYKGMKQTVHEECFSDKDLLLESISASLNTKFNILSIMISDVVQTFGSNASAAFEVFIKDVKDSQKALNNELSALAKAEDPAEFYERYSFLKKIEKQLADTVLGLESSSIYQIKDSCEELSTTLKDNKLQRDGVESFMKLLYNLFSRMFEKKAIVLMPSAKSTLSRKPEERVVTQRIST